MAYVKVRYRESASKLIQYCFDEKKPDDPVQAQECPDDEEGAKRAFEAVRNVHRVTSGYQAVHVIQSDDGQQDGRSDGFALLRRPSVSCGDAFA